MKLAEYLKKKSCGEEVTVWDTVFDMECYFYNDEPEDVWDESMWRLASVLDVASENKRGVTVNLYQVIDRNLDVLKESGLFIKCTTDAIMADMYAIISGYVSEEWFDKFTKCLK